MMNLKLIRWQPHWRVALVARFAQIVGVQIHVEGIPFGSSRTKTKVEFDNMPLTAAQSERFLTLGKEHGWQSK